MVGPPGAQLRRGTVWRAAAFLGLLGLQVSSAPSGSARVLPGASLTVNLAAGATASVQAWKSGGSWLLSVTNPPGTEHTSLVWADPAVTTLSWVADRAREFTVDCRPQAVTTATCELEIVEEVPKPEDAARQRIAEAAIRKGHALLGEWSPSARQLARASFLDAYEHGRVLRGSALQVDSLLGLARTHQLAGDLARSVPLLEEAVSRAAGSGDRRRLALASARLGSSLANTGHLERAERHLEEATEHAASSDFGLAAAEAHLVRGDVHYLRGALVGARREYRLARHGFQRLGSTPGTIESTLSIGYTLADLGEDSQAKNHFQHTLLLARQAGDRRLQAMALRVLGNVCSKLSEGHQAIRFFEAAQGLFEEAEDRVALVGLYNGLGEVHASLNDLEAAIQYHEKAEELARAVHRPSGQGSALIEIAKCQQLMERPEAAAQSYEKARRVFEALGDRAMVASALDGLGSAHAAAQRLETAIDYFKRAVALMRSVNETRQSSRVLSHLAQTHLAMGDTASARSAAREAVSMSRAAGDLSKEAQALFIWAEVDRADGALEEARVHVEQALAVDELVRSRAPGHDLRAMFFSGVQPRYGFYVDLLMDMEDSEPAAPFEQLAFEASEQARARVLLDALHARPPAGDESNGALDRREKALREEIRRRALLTDLEGRDGALEDQRRLREKLAELRRLRGLIGPGPTDSFPPDTSTTLSLSEIRSGVAEERMLLLEYLLGPKRSYLWVIGQDLFAAHVLPGRAVIETAAREAYASVTARQSDSQGPARDRRARAEREDARFLRSGALLARMLLGPIQELDEYDRLVIVADGLLHYIPLSALPHPRSAESGGGGYQPLLLTHEVLRVPSLSAAVAMRVRSRESRDTGRASMPGGGYRVAVLADPVFAPDDPRVRSAVRTAVTLAAELPPSLEVSLQGAGTGGKRLPRLLASRQEAFAIAKAGAKGDVSVVTDFQACRSTAEAMLQGSHRIVHFATHGVLNDEHPELSGIVTSLVDERGRLQDGFLRAQDVYALQVGAGLVVLSGCETALGRMVRGEGILGLVRAFIHSGADTVVASTWRVDDVATEELMGEFYRSLLVDDLDAAAALRAAQITLFRRKASRAPFFWAAFEVHGIP